MSDPSSLDVSVIICTRNRAESLRGTLESLGRLTLPEGTRWEVLIVDNGSTDATPAVIAEHEGRIPVRRLAEPTPGLSNARNCGLRAAAGRYIAWTDDDVLVDPDWLSAYLEAFRTWPEAAVFGGRITARIDPPTPPWFTEVRGALTHMLAERDFGDAPLPLSIAEDRLPYGANYAIRSEEQRRFPYDPAYGVAPGRALLGEEVLVIKAIFATGATGRWVPQSRVIHRIGHSRQTIPYVVQYHRAVGATAAQMEGRLDAQFLFGAPRWLWRRLPLLFLTYHWLRMTAPPSRWIEALKTLAHHEGVLRYWRDEARRSGTP
ncbi:glycosyltransferase [Roseomonas sp. HJA6]|uniref:Glycosyltransferase n=1 Tax=Roseomonas alba TaxID=2846776 RepID=A0ABS7A5C9_9PROT|nr:glycosyltransferase [Neoroseomonas alba]MBW6397522.1 glycosyltransferase [Neoroseomonas alba]